MDHIHLLVAFPLGGWELGAAEEEGLGAESSIVFFASLRESLRSLQYCRVPALVHLLVPPGSLSNIIYYRFKKVAYSHNIFTRRGGKVRVRKSRER
jgi:hypothetical protein